MLLFLLLATLLLVRCVDARIKKPASVAHIELDKSFENCTHTREEAIRYAGQFGDGDHDGRLCPAEIIELKTQVLNILERFLAWFYSIEKIMGDCDYDKDGFLTDKDFAHNGKTCIATCADVEKFFFFIVEPAKKMNYTPKRVSCEKKEN